MPSKRDMRVKVDQEWLLIELWNRSDRLNRLQIHQGELAKELGIGYQRLSVIFKQMTERGVIKKVKAKQGNVATYFINPPFTTDNVPMKVKRPPGSAGGRS